MPDATAIFNKEIHRTSGFSQYRFTTTNVGTSSTSNEIRLDIGRVKGSILHLRVSCGSTDFNISIRCKTGSVENTVDEVVKRTAANLRFIESLADSLGIFSNTDTIEGNYLYFVLDNNDSSNATGIITIDLFLVKN